MKAVFRSRPQFPRYKSVWNPEPVLTWLGNINHLSSISLELLTLKLVGLLALSTAQRVQTLSFMELKNIQVEESGITISISKITKTSAPGRAQPCLILPFFEELPHMCVASTLLEYIKRTKDLRLASEQVLISFKKPYKPVTSQTISRWIKLVLNRSGVDVSVFTAHSTRHVSTSKAASKGLDIETIRKTAGWSASSSTFQRFYNRPILNNESFCKAVLLSE